MWKNIKFYIQYVLNDNSQSLHYWMGPKWGVVQIAWLYNQIRVVSVI